MQNDFHQYVTENLDSSVQLTLELSTQIWKEKVVGGTHKGRVCGLRSRNDVRRLQSSLEGIGSSRQAKTLDGVQIAAMSVQITKLIAGLVESERRRVAEQESMSETVQQIKEQVMNPACRPTTSALPMTPTTRVMRMIMWAAETANWQFLLSKKL
ncbi:hypothetical protein H5410_061391 [Solanum commersonii]|uniref:Uncharacterized protein n=1 Tax=Solanum commersonii TaxID=4109 RepID=A0A9J5W7Y5_SOLCO|nr:hypothetical protein H5410_061391 [Solanum commersonii]